MPFRRSRHQRPARTHAFRLHVRRAITGNIARFLAVFCIVGIGAGVYAGLRMFVPDMYASADAFFDQYNLADVRVYSTSGLTDSDLEAIRGVDGIRGAAGMQVFEMSVTRSSSNSDGETDTGSENVEEAGDAENAEDDAAPAATTTVDTFELEVEAVHMDDYIESLDAVSGLDKNQDAVSRVRLVEGRLPQAANEIAVTTAGDGQGGGNIAVGDVLTVSSISGTDSVDNVLDQQTFTVVGLVQSPEWLSKSTSISPTTGAGITNCAYIDLSATAHPSLYTTVQATVADAFDKTAFTDAYDDAVSPAIEAIKQLAPHDEGSEQYWYVVGRDASPSCYLYKATAIRMDRICLIFPVFFFLVAALVCLTTTGRMVETDRTEIGTLKALGYSSGRIALKYLAFSSLASISGALVGIVIGVFTLPAAIWVPYSRMYVYFPFYLGFHEPDCIIAFAVSVGLAIAATLVATRRTLSESAASLLLPAAPKGGHRVWLERVRPLWRHLSFAKKVTARNVFRYKRRMIMIVVGVAGCTGLMLTGFGVQDKLDGFVQEQYGGIYTYDVMVNFDGDDFAVETANASEPAGDGDTSDGDGSAGGNGIVSEAISQATAIVSGNASGSGSGEAAQTDANQQLSSFVAALLGSEELGPGTDVEALESSQLTASLNETLGQQTIDDSSEAGAWCYFMRQSAIAANPNGDPERIPYGIGGKLDQTGGSIEAEMREGRSDQTDEQGADTTKGIIRDVGIYVPHSKAQDLIVIEDLDGNAIELPSEGAVITQRLAEQLMVDVGDTIELSLSADGETYEVRVAGIARYFVGHFVFLSPEAFEKTFGVAPTYNCVLGHNSTGMDMDELTTILAQADPSVQSVSVPSDESGRYEDVASSLNSIVVIVLVVSGMLVCVVVYALTEINLEERRRELATLKVLGFTRREVRGYVYRETYVLAALGICLGLPFGAWLCNFVMRAAEFDNVIFYRTISPECFALAALFTALFIFLVMLAMRKKINAIDMVSSLKSAE